MNYGPLIFFFAFLALAIMFRSHAAKAKDKAAATNARFISTMFFIAAAASLVAVPMSFFGD